MRMPLSSRSHIRFAPAVERRRLAALMFTDIVGYSAIFHRDEQCAMRMLAKKAQLLHGIFPGYGGREIKNLGDGYFIEFASVQEAVKCAYDIQSHIFQFNLGEPTEERFQIRIGIHLGDFIATETDAFGDDVNVSSRLEKIAPPGGICVSQQVVDQVRDKLNLRFTLLKHKPFKNIDRPIVCHSVDLPWLKERSESSFLAGRIRRATACRNVKELALTAIRYAVVPLMAVILLKYYKPAHAADSMAFYEGLGMGLKSLLVLNPLLSLVSLIMWFQHTQDRRTLYLSFCFGMASLTLPVIFHDFFGAFGAHDQLVLQVCGFGLIPLGFVALSAVDSKRGGVETGSVFAIIALAMWGLMGPPEHSEIQRIVVVIAASLSAGYLFRQVRRTFRRSQQIAWDDLRRGFYALACLASFAALSWQHPLFEGTGLPKFIQLFFPVTYPTFAVYVVIQRFISNGRELGRTSRNLQTLMQIGSHVSSQAPFNEKLIQVQEHICRNLGVERSTIYLTETDADVPRLRAAAAYGPNDRLKEVAGTVLSDHGVIGRVWRTRSPMIMNDVSTDERLSDGEREITRGRPSYSTGACMLVPLFVDDVTVGVMTFSDKTNGHYFCESDLRLAQLVAKDLALLALAQDAAERLTNRGHHAVKGSTCVS